MGTARSLSLRSMARHELDHKGHVELAGVLNSIADSIDRDADEIERLRAALQSIANNTCCNGCQEAAKVARAALNPRTDSATTLGQN